jgi:hypothetical protein
MEPLTELYFAAPVLEKESKEGDPAGSRRYAGLQGRSAAVADPAVQSALKHLGGVWPAIVPFEELRTAAGGASETLGQHLLQLAEANFVKVHAHSFRLARRFRISLAPAPSRAANSANASSPICFAKPWR